MPLPNQMLAHVHPSTGEWNRYGLGRFVDYRNSSHHGRLRRHDQWQRRRVRPLGAVVDHLAGICVACGPVPLHVPTDNDVQSHGAAALQPIVFFWYRIHPIENTIGGVVEHSDILADTIPHILDMCSRSPDFCLHIHRMDEHSDLHRGLQMMRDQSILDDVLVAIAPSIGQIFQNGTYFPSTFHAEMFYKEKCM